jgi:hypothetical protein
MPIIINVEGDWESDALVTRTTVKRFLKFENPTEDDAEHDSFIDILIAGCSHQFEKECDRTFTQTAFTEYHDADGKGQLFRVKNPPIAASPTPQLWEDTDYSFEDAFTLNTDFKYDPITGIVKLLYAPFNEGFQNIKISYTGGFSSIPDNVQEAIAKWCVLGFKESRDHREGLSSKAHAEYTTAFITSGIPGFVERVIKIYKRRSFSL